MSLELHLPSELENELAGEAARVGIPLPEYALRLLAAGRGVVADGGGTGSSVRTGAELVQYWRGEGLVGTRSPILDSQGQARGLRQ
jgi:hypothetical protein